VAAEVAEETHQQVQAEAVPVDYLRLQDHQLPQAQRTQLQLALVEVLVLLEQMVMLEATPHLIL
jgi:hypothetical protein